MSDDICQACEDLKLELAIAEMQVELRGATIAAMETREGVLRATIRSLEEEAVRAAHLARPGQAQLERRIRRLG